MKFWIILGLLLIVASLVMMAIRHVRGEDHVDTKLTSLFDWPMVVTGVLVMIPTWVWWDFTVGLLAMIAWEAYKWMQTKRLHAEHEYAVATTPKEEVA